MFTWRANTDASAVTSAIAIIQYIAKYVVKSEPQSDLLKMINEKELNKMNDNDTLRN